MKKNQIVGFYYFLACANKVYASVNVLPRANSESLGMADANVAIWTGPATQFINHANLMMTMEA